MTLPSPLGDREREAVNNIFIFTLERIDRTGEQLKM
jgi:hypothetical protein